jgi:hypothetical protein
MPPIQPSWHDTKALHYPPLTFEPQLTNASLTTQAVTKCHYTHAGSELTAVTMGCDTSHPIVHRCFGGTYCLHVQGIRMSQARSKHLYFLHASE